jgi:hypothetical protein
MRIVSHIIECQDKFVEEFGDSPNTVHMTPWLWDKIKEETRFDRVVGPRVQGYNATFIMDMRVQIDKALPAKNAIKIVRMEALTLTPVHAFEIMYLLPVIEENKSIWRHIIL